MYTSLDILTAVLGLIVVGVIPYLISLFKKMRVKTECDIKMILADLTTKLDQIKKFQEKSQEVHGLNALDIEIKDDINKLLESIRSTLRATRVTVWLFHNGNYFTNGSPQRKITTTFEAIDEDNSRLAEYDLIKGDVSEGFSSILKALILPPANTDIVKREAGITQYDPCSICKNKGSCSIGVDNIPRFCWVRCYTDQIPIGTKFSRTVRQLGTKIFWGHILTDDYGAPVGVFTILFNTINKEAEDMFINNVSYLCGKSLQLKQSLTNVRNTI